MRSIKLCLASLAFAVAAFGQGGIQQPAHVLGAFSANDCTKVNASGFIVDSATGVCPTAGATGGLFAVNGQTGTYQVLAADFTACKTITVASGTFTITLVASGSQPTTGQCISVINYGSGVVTIARSGQNINGGTASLTLPAASATAASSAWIVSDATNYFAWLSKTIIVSADLPATVVRTDQANTAGVAMTLDMSAATGATAFRVPSIAGATAGADGVIDYDSTAKITHVRTNGADSSIMSATSTSTTTTQVAHATAVAGIYAPSAIVSADLPTLTYTQSVFGGANLIPDSSGNVFTEPFTVLSASAFFAYQIMAFADTSTLDCMYTRWNVPINYTSTTTTWIIDWNTTATSGNAIWTLDYRDVSTATLAATTSQESLTVTTAASGTASARTQSSMTATAGNFSAGDIIQIRVCRNGAGADTIAATLAIHDIRFSYVGRP